MACDEPGMKVGLDVRIQKYAKTPHITIKGMHTFLLSP